MQHVAQKFEALVRELMQDIDICEPNSPFVAAVNAAVDQIETAIRSLGARCPRTLRCSVLALASRISTHEMPWAADPFVAAADALVAELHNEPASAYEATLWRVAALAGNVTSEIYPGVWAADASFAAVDRGERGVGGPHTGVDLGGDVPGERRDAPQGRLVRARGLVVQLGDERVGGGDERVGGPWHLVGRDPAGECEHAAA